MLFKGGFFPITALCLDEGRDGTIIYFIWFE